MSLNTVECMKKLLALTLLVPLLISCSSNKESDFNPNYVKDTNGFDILMGQFAHNIENIWGIKKFSLQALKIMLSIPMSIVPVVISTLMLGRLQ